MIETTMNPYDNDPIKMVIGSTRTLTEKEQKELHYWAFHISDGVQLPCNRDIVLLGNSLSSVIISVRFTYS